MRKTLFLYMLFKIGFQQTRTNIILLLPYLYYLENLNLHSIMAKAQRIISLILYTWCEGSSNIFCFSQVW